MTAGNWLYSARARRKSRFSSFIRRELSDQKIGSKTSRRIYGKRLRLEDFEPIKLNTVAENLFFRAPAREECSQKSAEKFLGATPLHGTQNFCAKRASTSTRIFVQISSFFGIEKMCKKTRICKFGCIRSRTNMTLMKAPTSPGNASSCNKKEAPHRWVASCVEQSK